jgi:hypothetical protein
MAIAPSITETQLFTALRAFLLTIVDCPVIRLPVNRVAMPAGDFVGMSPVGEVPLSTNVASYTDGAKNILRPAQVTIQIDCYGAGARDRASAIATLLRDEYACAQFAASGFDVQPLYAGDAQQMPLVDGEAQYEERWTFPAVLQCNAVVSVPQDSATALQVGLIEADRL